MKITYEKDEQGDLVLTFDNEDQLGTFVKLAMGDHTGLKLLLDMAAFYENKGHNMQRLLRNFLTEFEVERPLVRVKQGWTWKGFTDFLRGK